MRAAVLLVSMSLLSGTAVAQTATPKGVEEDIVKNTAATAANTEALLKRIQSLEEALTGGGALRQPVVIPGYSGTKDDINTLCKRLHFMVGDVFPAPTTTTATMNQLPPNPTGICYNL